MAEEKTIIEEKKKSIIEKGAECVKAVASCKTVQLIAAFGAGIGSTFVAKRTYEWLCEAFAVPVSEDETPDEESSEEMPF